ncbi:MAG TPA: DNA helicase RecQ [Thermoanaerobaculia bacterium]|nr:DNA helicase RecQ [Thermoanaerobaculia bacterium]
MNAKLIEVLARHWGFASFRPPQAEAMEAALAGKDTLVVMPTGSGKSLCYQAPAIVNGTLTVVVSPLISLMKDQVDGLVACGVAAAQLNSSQSSVEQRDVERALNERKLRLLFVSPERLAMANFRQLLGRAGVAAFAIDEAHCISQWGHDFRPEYRQLRDLRQLFPKASLHAFTATATERVRRDIAEQLGLRNPVELVGNFDRPNLTYRIIPRVDEVAQVEEVLRRHRREAGIIYCIRRRDVDTLAAILERRGYRVAAYHAGLSPDQRRAAQESFSTEACDIIVATVAFGMGIDRSNVRFVLHTGMPKSVEHYQQETGRAGRDGLEAECAMLYAPKDAAAWNAILAGTADTTAIENVDRMQQYTTSLVCRHKALVEYFGQTYENASCGACDVCLDAREAVPDSLVIAQKIVSCVVRAGETFGVAHIVAILRASSNEKIRERGHDKLSTWGILGSYSKEELSDWIGQLITQGFLKREGTQYPVLRLTPASRPMLRGAVEVSLVRGVAQVSTDASGGDATWTGVDHALFEELREWRKREADSRPVPPFTILGDAALRMLAAVRPSSVEKMKHISGIGEARLASFGAALLDVIISYCAKSGIAFDCPPPPPAPRREPSATPSRTEAYDAFRSGASIEEVMAITDRARSTISGYLADFIVTERPPTIDAWLPRDQYDTIAPAVERLGTERLKPIYEEFEGRISYDDIRLVVAHRVARVSSGTFPTRSRGDAEETGLSPRLRASA